MIKNKKIVIPIIVASVLVLVLLISSVIAYMFKKSPEIINKFFPALVSCEVNEELANDTTKTSVTVKNTGSIDEYIRVRVVVNWQDSKGNIVARPVPTITFTTNDTPGNGVFRYNNTDWIYDSQNQTFYCKKPIESGKSTPDLLNLGNSFKGVTLSPSGEYVGEVLYTYYPVIEFVAESIQAKSAIASTNKNAVESAWNVTIDEDGNISSVS